LDIKWRKAYTYKRFFKPKFIKLIAKPIEKIARNEKSIEFLVISQITNSCP